MLTPSLSILDQILSLSRTEFILNPENGDAVRGRPSSRFQGILTVVSPTTGESVEHGSAKGVHFCLGVLYCDSNECDRFFQT